VRIGEAEKAFEIGASLWMTHFGAAFAYLLLERFSEARESAEKPSILPHGIRSCRVFLQVF